MLPSWQVRVSQLDAYRDYLEHEGLEFEPFMGRLLDSQPNEAMLRGTAFHRALEISQESEWDVVASDGFTFVFDGNFAIELADIREIRAEKDYGGIVVSGKADQVIGSLVVDHKSTERFDAESYQRRYQWRFYLDIFKANRFRWNIFEMYEVGPRIYRVVDLHIVEQFRYPDLEADCQKMADSMRLFLEDAALVMPLPRSLYTEEEVSA